MSRLGWRGKEMKFNKNEEAVSPVIGVILMVAITVILAAVIAVFVFGMADDIQGTHVVSVTSKMVNDSHIMVTYQGGADANAVTKINATIYKGDTASDQTKELPESGKTLTVGNTITLKKDGGTRLLVTATFNDDATQVLIDKQI